MTVHALLGGFPLCGFSRDFPKDWPQGNKWTSVDDLQNISCEGCKEKAKALMSSDADAQKSDTSLELDESKYIKLINNPKISDDYKKTLGGRDL